MNQTYNKYINKVKNLIIENPIKKSFSLIRDYVKISKLSDEDLKKAAPNSWKVATEFKRDFREAVKKDMQSLEKKNSRNLIPESFQSENKVIYSEKFDLSQYVYMLPVAFYTFAFLLFIGEEKYDKFKVHIFNFLDKALGSYLNDPEIIEREKNKKD